jgi:hypothetical protein
MTRQTTPQACAPARAMLGARARAVIGTPGVYGTDGDRPLATRANAADALLA